LAQVRSLLAEHPEWSRYRLSQHFTLYFFHQQLLPFDRLRQTCLDLFGQPLSLGTLTQTNQNVNTTCHSIVSL